MKSFVCLTAIIVLFLSCAVFANTAPQVTNVTASQREDESGIVDIHYTVYDAESDLCTVVVQVSNNAGLSFDVEAEAMTGDIGKNINNGNKHIIWYSKSDIPSAYGNNYQVKVIANDNVIPGPSSMLWVYVANDPGVGSYDGFSGYVSKYETTNGQYCEFLNEALASGDIVVSNNIVYGAAGSNGGQDYVGQIYLKTNAADPQCQIVYKNSSFSVQSRDNKFMTSHPVVMVSWYGAKAFCNYYGFILPTEWQWQAIADYKGSYIYGCGTTISTSMANYNQANPLNLTEFPYTTSVGYYLPRGYGACDMAGNVWEWTDSCFYEGNTGYMVYKGGCWQHGDNYCEVSARGPGCPNVCLNVVGFRACRQP